MTVGGERLPSVKHGLTNPEPEVLYMVKLGAQSRLWNTKLLSAVDAMGKWSLAGIRLKIIPVYCATWNGHVKDMNAHDDAVWLSLGRLGWCRCRANSGEAKKSDYILFIIYYCAIGRYQMRPLIGVIGGLSMYGLFSCLLCTIEQAKMYVIFALLFFHDHKQRLIHKKPRAQASAPSSKLQDPSPGSLCPR